MTAYLLRISSIINAFVYGMQYIGNHLSSYPGVIILISLWVIIFVVSTLKKLCD